MKTALGSEGQITITVKIREQAQRLEFEGTAPFLRAINVVERQAWRNYAVSARNVFRLPPLKIDWIILVDQRSRLQAGGNDDERPKFPTWRLRAP
jgi:hypothetical protein